MLIKPDPADSLITGLTCLITACICINPETQHLCQTQTQSDVYSLQSSDYQFNTTNTTSWRDIVSFLSISLKPPSESRNSHSCWSPCPLYNLPLLLTQCIYYPLCIYFPVCIYIYPVCIYKQFSFQMILLLLHYTATPQVTSLYFWIIFIIIVIVLLFLKLVHVL